MVQQPGPVQPLHRLALAERRPPVRMGTVQRGQQRIEHEGKRQVAAVADLAQDHPALVLDLLGRQARPERHVGDEVQERLPVAGERRPAKLGVVRVPRSAHAPADLLGGLRDRLGAPPDRPFDHDVLEEIRDAGVLGALPAPAHLDMERDGHDGRGRVLPDQERQAVREPVTQHGREMAGRRSGARNQREPRRHDQPERPGHGVVHRAPPGGVKASTA